MVNEIPNSRVMIGEPLSSFQEWMLTVVMLESGQTFVCGFQKFNPRRKNCLFNWFIRYRQFTDLYKVIHCP